MSEDTDFVDTMDTWLQARMEAVHTTLPGKIQEYNPDTRLATVVPGVSLRSMHGDIIALKPIAGVPVVWPGSSRFSVIPGTLQAGDGVLLHFSEASLGEWLNGSDVHDPEDETRFSLHDCIAVPGLWQVSRVPGGHNLGGADFGMAGDQGEVLGAKDGKLDLHTDLTTMRRELERLWDAIRTVHSDLYSQFTTLAEATGSPTSLATAFTTVADLQTSAATDVDTTLKPNVKDLCV